MIRKIHDLKFKKTEYQSGTIQYEAMSKDLLFAKISHTPKIVYLDESTYPSEIRITYYYGRCEVVDEFDGVTLESVRYEYEGDWSLDIAEQQVIDEFNVWLDEFSTTNINEEQ